MGDVAEPEPSAVLLRPLMFWFILHLRSLRLSVGTQRLVVSGTVHTLRSPLGHLHSLSLVAGFLPRPRLSIERIGSTGGTNLPDTFRLRYYVQPPAPTLSPAGRCWNCSSCPQPVLDALPCSD